jgi:hypothetical protein
MTRVAMAFAGAGIATVGLLTLAGVVTFAGSGGDSLAARLVLGVLYGGGGLATVAAAVVGSRTGRVEVSPPPASGGPETDPYHSSGLGDYAPGGRANNQHRYGEI